MGGEGSGEESLAVDQPPIPLVIDSVWSLSTSKYCILKGGSEIGKMALGFEY